jgi:predicted CopG family antitoxin
MAVKTITIDVEAYEALARHKGKGESFSQVIKAHFGGRRTGRDLKRIVEQLRIPEATIDHIDDAVKARRRSPVRAARV